MKIELTKKEAGLFKAVPKQLKELAQIPALKVSEEDKNIVVEIDEKYILDMGEEYKSLLVGFSGLGATAGILVKNFMFNTAKIYKRYTSPEREE